MLIKLITSLLLWSGLFFFSMPQLLGQIDTIAYYKSIEGKSLNNQKYHTITTRFTIDKPGHLTGLVIHTNSSETGSCLVHVYGHQGGTSKPTHKKELISPIIANKEKVGAEAIKVAFPSPIFLQNDQFFIKLDGFKGNFGISLDTSYLVDPCRGKDSGIFAPTQLNNRNENYYPSIDALIKYLPLDAPIFQDITTAVGIDSSIINHSIAWGDIDKDNWLDLLIGGYLYKNEKGQFKDITSQLAITNNASIKASAFIDIENDGDQDLLILDTQGSYLLINDGTGQFTKKQLAFPPLIDPSGLSIADINNDKLPDVVITQLWSRYPVPLPNYLFLNNGQLGFKDITKRLYPYHHKDSNFPTGRYKNRRSRGTQFVDFDLDGDQDLYITNYFLEKDEFYENDGMGNFKERPAPISKNSLNKGNHGTGVDWYDFDNDGDFDLLLPQFAHARNINRLGQKGTQLFENDEGKFIPIDSSGIAYEESHAGASFGDVNNDGLVDLVSTVFYPCRYIDFYLQQPDHTFKMSTAAAGLAKITTGNDACFVDYNNDGLLDLAMGKNNNFRLFKNVQSINNNWIKLSLRSQSKNYFGIGAIVKVHTDLGVYTQEMTAGRGQKMQKPSVLHFGLGTNDKIEQVEVFWDQDKVETYTGLTVNSSYFLLEQQGNNAGEWIKIETKSTFSFFKILLGGLLVFLLFLFVWKYLR